MIFNSIDLTSIKKLEMLMNFDDNKFWEFTNVLWSIILWFLLDHYK